jgi:undecaprenyl-diphosphatase
MVINPFMCFLHIISLFSFSLYILSYYTPYKNIFLLRNSWRGYYQLLRLIEGLTEFLPVSSTGHLIILSKYINFTGEFANTFNVVIQFGAILAVIIYFKNKLFPSRRDRTHSRKVYSLWGKVVVGIIPAVFAGVLLEDYIDKYLMDNALAVAGALIVGAVILLYLESKKKRAKVATTDEISYKQSFIIGVAQCMAMWPGMSRSASTIIGGLFLGLSREAAAEYSFFLAVPTIAGAAVLKMYKFIKAGFVISKSEWMLLFIGTVVSFIVAYVVIAAFMDYIRKRKLNPFAYYRIILGVLVIIFSLL